MQGHSTDEVMARMNHDPETDAEIDSAIRENLRATNWGQVLSARGIAIVFMDDDGQLVRQDPDGTRTVLGSHVDSGESDDRSGERPST